MRRTAGTAAMLSARNAVAAVFVLNGVVVASLAARIPAVRSALELSNTAVGVLLLAVAAGSLGALGLSGILVDRWGAANVVRTGAVVSAAGLLVAGLGAGTASDVALTAVGLVGYGVGNGAWDVAMNVEAAEVERQLRRTVMPRFHAGWSIGSFLGAGLGVAATAVGIPLAAHIGGVGVVAALAAATVARRFLPGADPAAGPAKRPTVRARTAWTEPRTVLVGVMVLCFATAEGAANDWLALAIVDGYAAPQWVGVAGFAVFVGAMTLGRLAGPRLLDRWGRVRVLSAAALVAATGAVLVVLGAVVPADGPMAAVGIVLWGLGVALGFPVGMSAAADDEHGAGARVSVVATIGYGAILTGPPLLGALGDVVGTLPAMTAVPVLMVVAVALVPAARERGRPAPTR